jgi:hypothetical protein
MRPRIKFPPRTVNKMEQLLLATKDLNEYKRIQCIYFRAKFDYDTELISQITGYKKQTINNIFSSFLLNGVKSLKINKKGGRYNEIFTLKEEKELIDEFEKKSKQGGILEVSKIHKACEERANKKIAKTTIYRMLDRHNWRKITPRTSHPKSNEKYIDNFKKTTNI